MMVKTNGCRRATRAVSCTMMAAAFMAAFHAAPAQAAQIGVQDDVAKTYTVTVASGNTVELSDEDAAALLALDAGYTFVKAGTGKLVVSNQIAMFAGPIVITNGTYEALSSNALGEGGEGAETYVRTGASLCIYNKTTDGVTFTNEIISIAGVGYNNKGALYNRSGSTEQKNLLTKNSALVLDADATICGDTIGFNGGKAYFDGHKLTVGMAIASSLRVFNLTFGEIKTAGDIHLTSGRFFFSGTTRYVGGSEITFTADDGTSVAFRNVTVPIPWTLVVDGDINLYPSNPKSDAKYSANVWSGPVILNGRATVSYSNGASSVAITGPVSGTGSFVVYNQNKLHLSCPTNTFTGGVLVAGGDNTCTFTVGGEKALPPDGGTLEVHNGTVSLTKGPVALPAVNSITAGSAIITNTSSCSSVKTPSLTKDGTGVLTVYGGIAVTNMLSVCTGKVELVGFTTNAQNAAGLYMYSTNFGSIVALTNYFSESIGLKFTKTLEADELRAVFDHVVDIRRDSPAMVGGVDLAFSTKWATAQKWSMYAYTGYLRNLTETNVTVTFGLSVWDVEALWIDGENLIANSGTRYTKPNSKTFCLQLNDVKLAPGPHKIEILLGHWTASNGGAQASINPGETTDAINWPAGHGFVLRYGKNDDNRFYEGAGYIDVKNGDALGTILTRTADPLPEDLVASGSRYRAEFANLAGQATGTLDLGGDMFPRPVNGLSGTLTVTNGALEVTGAWTMTLEELTASPLVVAPGARLTFGEGATFVPDESLVRGLHTIVIAETAGDGAIEGCPRCDSSDWATRRVQEDGKTRIYLSLRPGFKLILR